MVKMVARFIMAGVAYTIEGDTYSGDTEGDTTEFQQIVYMLTKKGIATVPVKEEDK